MGEHEQGGMLRNVVVLGLIALIAAMVISLTLTLKTKMTKHVDQGVGTIVTTRVEHTVNNKNVTYGDYTPNKTSYSGWGDHAMWFPVIGDIPPNSWRDVQMVVSTTSKIYFRVDVNTANDHDAKDGNNDHDEMSKRTLMVYDSKGKLLKSIHDLRAKTYLEPNEQYTVVVKYFNNSKETFNDNNNPDRIQYQLSSFITGSDNGKAYALNFENFEAATYDDKYLNLDD